MADERHEGPTDPERTVEEETVELRRGIPEPEGYPYDGDLEADALVVSRSERERRNPDGTVDRSVVQVEERRRRPTDQIAIAVGLVLLVLAIVGGVLWYVLAQGEDTKAVPAVQGLPAQQAVAELESAGFQVSTATEASDSPSGTVFAQDPSSGTQAEEGSTVTIRVSSGPNAIAVPNAVGLPEADARDRLVSAGFQVQSNEVFSDRDPGTVTAQSPNAGAEAKRGSTVEIDVSKGSGMVAVPNVVGMTRGQAEAELSNVQLEANVVEVPSDEPVGTVVAQNPVGGQAQQGSTVRLNVSAGR